jgi:hypothetical protein
MAEKPKELDSAGWKTVAKRAPSFARSFLGVVWVEAAIDPLAPF